MGLIWGGATVWAHMACGEGAADGAAEVMCVATAEGDVAPGPDDAG